MSPCSGAACRRVLTSSRADAHVLPSLGNLNFPVGCGNRLNFWPCTSCVRDAILESVRILCYLTQRSSVASSYSVQGHRGCSTSMYLFWKKWQSPELLPFVAFTSSPVLYLTHVVARYCVVAVLPLLSLPSIDARCGAGLDCWRTCVLLLLLSHSWICSCSILTLSCDIHFVLWFCALDMCVDMS
jgi:hypothetical protein